MSRLAYEVSELAPAVRGRGSIRLPDLQTVPLTSAVAAVVDHPHFQRLRRVRQLGPTLLVYPGATHTRFEHSLGVYGTVVLYLRALLGHPSVADALDAVSIRTVLAAGLLHDIGHYPFAHTLEAVHLGGSQAGLDTPRHEDLLGPILEGRAPGLAPHHEPLARVLERQLRVRPERVVRLVSAKRAALADPVDRLLQSIVSSALDADKMDYLWRDSVHLGVPYGRNYDRERLLASLTLGPDEDALAIDAKGTISAEVFLFCRYTMFSEVYWHHAVRACSAMLEAAFADYLRRDRPELPDLTSRLLAVGDDQLLETFAAEAPPGSAMARLLHGLTGDRRRPYKRVVTWSRAYDDPKKLQAFERLHSLEGEAHEALVERLRHVLAPGRRPLPEGAVLLDVPPRDKDRMPDIAVHRCGAQGGRGTFAQLAELSQIVRAIGADFIRVVKRIRLFVHPDHVEALQGRQPEIEAAVHRAVMDG